MRGQSINVTDVDYREFGNLFERKITSEVEDFPSMSSVIGRYEGNIGIAVLLNQNIIPSIIRTLRLLIKCFGKEWKGKLRYSR